MFISSIEDIIGGSDLATATRVMKMGGFVSGAISGGTDSDKRNLELPPSDEGYLELLKLVERSVRSSQEFMFTAFPRAMTRPIFSKYETGMFYKEHTDFPIMNFYSPAKLGEVDRTLAPLGASYVRSDLSMTLFLNDPEDYDGGALTFAAHGETLKFKLKAGAGVVYPTGAPHAVEPVTRGARMAAVFWIQSMFSEEARRRLVHQAFQLNQLIEANRPGSPEAALSEQISHSAFRILADV